MEGHMGKVLDALREAERRNRVLKERFGQLPEPATARLLETPKAGTEDQMTGLYYTVESLLAGEGTKTVQIIGSQLGDGASTVACSFAQAVAYRLNKVLLLLSSDVALADANWVLPQNSVRHFSDIVDAIRSPDKNLLHDADNNLYVSVFYGKRGTEEDNSEKSHTSELWDMLKERFDMIVVDSPPIDVNPDGLVVARRVDGTIIVVRAEKTPWPLALNTKERLERQGANVIGTVFNDQHVHLPKWLSSRLGS